MRHRLLSPFVLCLLAGMAVTFVLAELLVPNLEKVLPHPWDNLILGFGGAFLGGLAHELATTILSKRDGRSDSSQQ